MSTQQRLTLVNLVAVQNALVATNVDMVAKVSATVAPSYLSRWHFGWSDDALSDGGKPKSAHRPPMGCRLPRSVGIPTACSITSQAAGRRLRSIDRAVRAERLGFEIAK